MNKLLFTLLLCFLVPIARSQVSPYCFSQATVTYTAITGGTVLGTTANDDESFQGLPIGFTFNFKGTNFTQFCVNANGYITLGAVDNGPAYTPISFPADDNIISVFGADLQAQTGSTLRYQTTGTAPNRILTVQWLNYTPYGETWNTNFQLRLLEGTNVIQFNYGAFTLTAATSAFVEVGLRGSTLDETDFSNVEIIDGTNTWATPQILLSNLFSGCDLTGTAFKPASGLRYIWTPSTLTNVTNPPGFCPPSTVTLNATASSGTINWYNDPTTATVSGTGTSFITPTLSTADTFYVAMNGCVTQRIPVYINPNASIPSRYSFTQNSSTYAAVTGGTVLGTIANDEETFENLPIGFTFNFNGTNFTNFSVATNGFISLGTILTPNTSPISFPIEDNIISVLGADLEGQAGSSLRYVLSGTAPNRVLTVQWQNYNYFGETGITYNAQIKLFETSNIVQVIYGGITQTAGTIHAFEVGISGDALNENDFSGRNIVEGTNTWATSANATTRFDSYGEFNDNTFKPASGQRYIWTPLQINSSTPTTICSGNTATISVTPSTGTASWFANPTGGSGLATNNSFTTPVLTATTTYYAQLTGSLCPILPRTAVTVTVNPAPATPTVTAGGPTTFCAGGSVLLTSSVGTTYQWRLNGTPIGGATASTYSATTAGTYTVIITNASGCQSLASAGTVVTVNAAPATPTVTAGGPTTFCSGGSVLLTSSAGTTYQWRLNGTPIGGATASTYSATASGTYSIIITNASGCQSLASAETVVTVNAAPATPTVTAGGPTTFCAGGSVTLTASSGTTYQWKLNGTNISGATASTFNTTASGTYTVVITNASGCSSTASAGTVVTVNPGPTITLGTQTNPTSCTLNNGSIQVNGSGTGNLAWTGTASGSLSSITLPTTITNLGAGAYTITFTSAAGCVSNTLNGSLTAPSAPAAPTITAGGPTTFCAGGSVTLTSSAGSTYLWSTGATTASITVSTAGSYTVSITNAAGCSSPSSSATTVTVNSLPATPTVTAGGPTTFCAGGSVILTSSAGTTYQWKLDGTNISGATASTYNATALGTYTVVITNASGCSSTASAGTVVTVNALPAIPIITAGGPTTFCAGGSVTLTSSTGSSYLWSNGATTQSIIVTTSGNYTVQVTNASGCQSTASSGTIVTVNPIPPTPIGTASGPTTFCAGSSVTLTSSTGSSYLWSNGATTQSIIVTSSGIYTVQVINALGCQSTASSGTVVTVNPLPATPIVTAVGPTIFCDGGIVTLTSSVESSYLWSNGATTQSIDVTSGGTYDVIVTNTQGCQSLVSLPTVVTVNPVPLINVQSSTDPTTCGGTDGQVTINSTESGDLTWSGTSTGSLTNPTYPATINGLTAGAYSFIVTTSAGCVSSSVNSSLSDPGAPANPIITASGPLTFCDGGSVDLSSSYSTGNTWSGSETSQTISVSTSGTYTVSVTVSGCTSTSDPIDVVVNPLPVVSFSIADDSLCQTSPSVVLSGGTPTGGTYSGTGISSGAFNPSVAGLGSFPVIYSVVDANSCSASATQNIVVVDCSGIEESKLNVGLYPNPSSGLVYVSTDQDNVEIEVYDFNGRIVIQKQVKNGDTIDLSNFEDGLYVFRLKNDLNHTSKVIVKN